MEDFIKNFDLNQLVLFLVGIGIILQRLRTVEKAVETVGGDITALDTKFATALQRTNDKVDDSLSRMHSRVNENSANVNRHDGIFETLIPAHQESRRRINQPQGHGAD